MKTNASSLLQEMLNMEAECTKVLKGTGELSYSLADCNELATHV